MPSSPSTAGETSDSRHLPWQVNCLGRRVVSGHVHGCGRSGFLRDSFESVEDSGTVPVGISSSVLPSPDPLRGRAGVPRGTCGPWGRSPCCLASEDAFSLSWPGFHQAPLLGFSKTVPPSTQTCDVHSSSLSPVARFLVASAPSCHAWGPVPPSRFLTALTACSARTLRVCCAPLPVRGSPRFSRTSSGPEGPDACGHPRDAYFPSKDSPRR